MSRPGSLEDVFQTGVKQSYKFQEKEIPKGSATFQLVVTDCEGEKTKTDTDEDDDIDRPSDEYMNRRRNTVGEAYGNSRRKSVHFDMIRNRKASLMPGMSRFRSRSPSPNLGVVVEGITTRTRSLSPLVQNQERRNSISTQDLAFGSTKDRECVLR